MKKVVAIILAGGILGVYADDGYTLGQGLKSDKLPITVGGYVTGFYSNGSNGQSSVSLDDVAIMGHGDIAPNLNAMVEFESAGFFEKTFQNGVADERYRGTLRIERAYLSYSFTDAMNLRVGKFVTPAGIWNQTPIPVFKDTFSKPRLSMEMFPRFSTGIMMYGVAPMLESDIEYSLFAQVGPDLDPAYNNIEANNGFGGSVTVTTDGWSGGLAVGQYKNIQLDDKTKYAGIYQSYSNGPFKLIAEAFVSYDEYNMAGINDRHYKKQSYYIQSAYRVAPKLTAVWRNEYFKNEANSDAGTINTVGLNYKPRPAISLKLEKQFSSQKANDAVIASFSVLF